MDDIYPCTHNKQGQALVFVNDTFQEQTEQEDRAGAEHDIRHFAEAYERCGLTVTVHRNLDLKTTLTTLIQFSRDPERKKENMMVVAFSTHGEQMELKSSTTDNVAADAIFCTDKIVRVSSLTKLFTEHNCPGMAGKPKLFFIQACRGLKYDTTMMSIDDSWEQITMAFPDPPIRPVVEIPIYKDFFLAYSAPPGYLSFRSSSTGSWFVRSLHDVIMAHINDHDLVSMLTLVKNQVALSEEFKVKNPHPDYPHEMDRKIVPWTVSMLTKDLYFIR